MKKFSASSAVICSTTSISTHSPNLESTEYGYNRDGKNLPQINLTHVADQNSGLPICYRTLAGSLLDVSSLQCSSSMLKELGLESFPFRLIADFYSQSNINEMFAKGLDFLIGVPFSVKQTSSHVRRFRTGVDESATGRMLIAFISLILRAELENRMRKAQLLYQTLVPLLLAQTRKKKTIFMSSERGCY